MLVLTDNPLQAHNVVCTILDQIRSIIHVKSFWKVISMGLQSNVCKEWTIDFKNFFLNSSLTLVGCTLLIHSYFFTWNIAAMNSEIVYNVKTKTWNWKIHLFLDIKISRGKNNSEFQFTTTQPLVEFLPTLKVWSLTHKNTTSCLIYYTRPLPNFQTSNFF